jgi:hypothetical protein
MNEKVVFLAFSNERVEPEGRDFLACKYCRNKTFTAIFEGAETFPLMQCAACGSHMGHFGWAHEK